jgi:hypothetical protein
MQPRENDAQSPKANRIAIRAEGENMGRDYIASNSAATSRMRALAERLSDDDLQRKLDHGWSVAVAFLHIAFFDRRTSVLVERWQRDGYSPSPYDPDAINDAMLPAWELIPLRAAVAEALSAAIAADEAVANLSDDLLTTIQEQGGIRTDRAHHRDSHLDEVEALLA